MKTILVTGANGQLGNSIRSLLKKQTQFNYIFTDIEEVDIADKDALLSVVKENAVDYIINCAAYTAVDKAEDDEIVCLRINQDAVRNVGEVAASTGTKVIHISTDYVFDGTNSVPYLETDYTCPMSAYGRSKQAGELILRAVCKNAVIIRTAWLYSEYGNNFLNTMLRLGKEKKEIGVVFDQVGTPTYAGDLAKAILSIIEHSEAGGFEKGIFHYTNEGVCSWYDFARKIFELSGLDCNVTPIETKDYPTRATRPQYSVLNKKKIKKIYGITIPHWEDSLKKMIGCLNIND